MNTKKGLISIITPVYNGEKYIERCIRSIQAQTYKDIEHIVVDDGSQDNTKKICEKYNDKIIFISKKNEGVSNARNTALNCANGEYVLFVDADDWLEVDMCELLIKELEKKACDIVVCGYNNYYENSGKNEPILLKFDETVQNSFKELISDETTNFGGFPWNKLIRRDVITHLFDESIHYYENLLFFLENCNYDIRFSTVNKCLYNYCINDTSAVHSKKYSIKKLSALESLKKVISLLPTKTLIMHKVYFINSYFNNLYYIKKYFPEHIDDIKKYNILLEEYYNDVMKSCDISSNTKIKIFFMKKMNFIYEIYKGLKK